METEIQRRRPRLLRVQALILILWSASKTLSTVANLLTWINQHLLIFRRLKLEFDGRPDDIFIVTYPRSGTTWTQMILYQLITDGDMELTHMSRFSPYFELSALMEQDLNEFPSPRVFKTHLPYRRIPKGPCKYIYVARDGRDVAVSYFHFYTGFRNFRGDFPAFFNRFMRGRVQYGSWFDHVSEWWSHRNDPNVLLLRYEEFVDDLEGVIRRIGEFCGLAIDPERMPLIVERCGIGFMKKHEGKFGVENVTYDRSQFIRKGSVGDFRDYLSDVQQTLFQAKFDEKLCELGSDFFRIGDHERQVPSASTSGITT
jgi:hypothetical protein